MDMIHHKKSAELYAHLNEQQYQAVVHERGAQLVLAGAGSGKTRVITSRIVHLMTQQNVQPSSIIALTFTNKAAHEMKERIARGIGEQKSLPFIGTFHAYCLTLLKRYAHRSGIPQFSIIDEDDQRKIISDILHKEGLTKQYAAKTVLGRISYLKSHSLEPEREALAFFGHPTMYELYVRYEQEKRKSNCFDFDDLLHETVHLFKKDADFKAQFNRTIRHILVDEYQDTNKIQHALLVLMAKEGEHCVVDSLCAVGDEDQSIYSWRGATVENILSFKADFPDVSIVKIEQNYRSVQPILDLANHLIAHNTKRNPKNVWSERKGTDRIRFVACGSQYQEADLVVSFVREVRSKSNRSCAVLYRTHTQSRSIEEAFLKQSIPYKVVGGIQFYERKEIKDLLAYARLIVNPHDRLAALRAMQVPSRGLGPKVEEQVLELWNQEPLFTFDAVFRALLDQGIITGKKRDSVAAFLSVFQELSPDQKPGFVLTEIVKRIRYTQYIQDEYDTQEAQDRIAIVTELMNAIRYLEETKTTTLDLFLQEVMLMNDLAQKQSHSQDQECVFLMTLHAAKGLEFDCVALVGLEEGILPSNRSIEEPGALEEERRLLYVGITRAKEWLLLTYAKTRYLYGQHSDQRKSRFADDMALLLIAQDDCSNWRSYQLSNYCGAWINGTTKSEHVAPRTYAKNYFAKTESKIDDSIQQKKWKKNDLVQHAQYGVGMVMAVEEKMNGALFLEINFKTGRKKISADFVAKVSF